VVCLRSRGSKAAREEKNVVACRDRTRLRKNGRALEGRDPPGQIGTARKEMKLAGRRQGVRGGCGDVSEGLSPNLKAGNR